MHVLVTGATGFVGSRLVPTLVERGHEVSVLTRDADGYDGAAQTVYEGDVLEAGSFEHALESVDAAYYFIHSMGASDDFAENDRRGAHNFQRAASEAGLDRVIYLSGLGDDRIDLSPHLASRREIETILGQGSFDLTTLRAAVIIGKGNTSFDLVKQLSTRLPILVTPYWIQVDCQPIDISDVVAYLVGVLETPETAGHTYDIGGDEVLTYAELLTRTADAADRRTVIVPSRLQTTRLASFWAQFVTDVSADVAAHLIEGLENEVTVEDTSIRDVVPIELTPYDDSIKWALDPDDDIAAETKRVLAKLG